ncbi:TPA: hypothetical protein QCX73_005385 [Bacillus mycoides]|nr:hypothetical protein [Bacillus mycoides]HDR7630679.1 hypothetical protein [Bacillus mycoides]
MNTKLIIVEGLPGFGKSTTTNLLYDILIEKNIDVELFLEGNPNKAHIFLTESYLMLQVQTIDG